MFSVWEGYGVGDRTGGVASTMLSMPSGWGLTFGAISFYYDLLFKWRVLLALDHYCYQKGALSSCFYKNNE